MPVVGDFAQTADGQIWFHFEWGNYIAANGTRVTSWNEITPLKVIAHGTIHWRDAHFDR